MFTVITRLQSVHQFQLAYAEVFCFFFFPMTLDSVNNLSESGRNSKMGVSTTFRLSHDGIVMIMIFKCSYISKLCNLQTLRSSRTR